MQIPKELLDALYRHRYGLLGDGELWRGPVICFIEVALQKPESGTSLYTLVKKRDLGAGEWLS